MLRSSLRHTKPTFDKKSTTNDTVTQLQKAVVVVVNKQTLPILARKNTKKSILKMVYVEVCTFLTQSCTECIKFYQQLFICCDTGRGLVLWLVSYVLLS